MIKTTEMSSRGRFLAPLICMLLAASAFAADKLSPSPDTPSPFVTESRFSATIEFGLPALAASLERDIPRRLATIDERVNCVHRRVFVFRVNANCDIWGYVERTGGVSLYGRGDLVIGAVTIRGVVSAQGANRFTSRIHGEAEAGATVEAEAKPQLRRDWSLDLNLSDSLHWNEPPVLHVLGRDIALERYVEPRVRTQLATIRWRALAAARSLDLRGKAEAAWREAFAPIQISDDPKAWVQITPQTAAFAGVRATGKVLDGSLEFSAHVETVIGDAPSPAAPTPLPPLGDEVHAPGTFDVIIPVHIGYDVLRAKIMETIGAAPKSDLSLRDVQIYPSSGKLVVGLRIAKSSDADPGAGDWIYLSGAPKADPGSATITVPDLAALGNDIGPLLGNDQLLEQLRRQVSVSYLATYQKWLDSANQRLKRTLKNGFRMEGHLAAARLDKILLLSDGVVLAFHANGELKILYGL